jgi:hypothetical protein
MKKSPRIIPPIEQRSIDLDSHGCDSRGFFLRKQTKEAEKENAECKSGKDKNKGTENKKKDG